jgi:hypothetical protein
VLTDVFGCVGVVVGVLLMTHRVVLFGTLSSHQLGEEAVRLLLVYLLEVGHLLLVHLRSYSRSSPFRSADVGSTQQLVCRPEEPPDPLLVVP